MAASPFQRKDGRRHNEMRPVRITGKYLANPEGSALIELGNTVVLCAVSIEDRLPQFLRGTGSGWITAEYGMLPRSTATRTPREAVTGRQAGRSQEIQRLIGRSLRAVTNLDLIGERTFIVDCDVLQADGGTRTAAITGSFVALCQALGTLMAKGDVSSLPVKGAVAAASVGLVGDVALLDLCYEEDSQAEVDFNVVMTDDGRFVEVQGAAEGNPFSREMMDELLALAREGIQGLFKAQKQALGKIGIPAEG
jgi:ribonuclease PH